MRYTVAAAFLASSAMASYEDVSTDYTTQLVTITSCAPEVTNCPADEATTHVTSTVLPLTTSTVYETRINTIVSCPSNIVKCPSSSTVIEYETIAVSTTVCPVIPTDVPEKPQQPEEPCYGPKCPKTEETEKPEKPEHPCYGPECPKPELPEKPTAHHNGTVTYTKPSHPEVTKPVVPVVTEPAVPVEPQCVPSHSVKAVTKSYTSVITTVEYETVEVPCPTGGAEKPTGPAVPPPAATTPVYQPPKHNETIPSHPPAVTAGAASLAGSAIFAAVAGVAAFILV